MMTTQFDISSGEIITASVEQPAEPLGHEQQASLQLVIADVQPICPHTMPPELFDIPVTAFLNSQK